MPWYPWLLSVELLCAAHTTMKAAGYSLYSHSPILDGRRFVITLSCCGGRGADGGPIIVGSDYIYKLTLFLEDQAAQLNPRPACLPACLRIYYVTRHKVS